MTQRDPPLAYADLNNADRSGRVRLNCAGTEQDLSRQGLHLREGAVLMLYDEDLDDAGQPDRLLVRGVVE